MENPEQVWTEERKFQPPIGKWGIWFDAHIPKRFAGWFVVGHYGTKEEAQRAADDLNKARINL